LSSDAPLRLRRRVVQLDDLGNRGDVFGLLVVLVETNEAREP
jgi:hypothetical protein